MDNLEKNLREIITDNNNMLESECSKLLNKYNINDIDCNDIGFIFDDSSKMLNHCPCKFIKDYERSRNELSKKIRINIQSVEKRKNQSKVFKTGTKSGCWIWGKAGLGKTTITAKIVDSIIKDAAFKCVHKTFSWYSKRQLKEKFFARWEKGNPVVFNTDIVVFSYIDQGRFTEEQEESFLQSLIDIKHSHVLITSSCNISDFSKKFNLIDKGLLVNTIRGLCVECQM